MSLLEKGDDGDRLMVEQMFLGRVVTPGSTAELHLRFLSGYLHSPNTKKALFDRRWWETTVFILEPKRDAEILLARAVDSGCSQSRDPPTVPFNALRIQRPPAWDHPPESHNLNYGTKRLILL